MLRSVCVLVLLGTERVGDDDSIRRFFGFDIVSTQLLGE